MAWMPSVFKNAIIKPLLEKPNTDLRTCGPQHTPRLLGEA